MQLASGRIPKLPFYRIALREQLVIAQSSELEDFKFLFQNRCRIAEEIKIYFAIIAHRGPDWMLHPGTKLHDYPSFSISIARSTMKLNVLF